MIKELKLTPEELFYLGKLYEGKYFNYSYIKAMEDMGNARSFKGKCKETLMEKGIIEENLLGDLTFNEEVKSVLEPIYFGEFTSSVEIYDVSEKKKKVMDFYFGDEKCIAVWLNGENYQIVAMTEDELKYFIVAMMPENYHESTPPESLELKKEDLKRILAVKNIEVGKRALVNVYYDYCDYLFEQNQEGVLQILSPGSFFEKVYRGLKGEM